MDEQFLYRSLGVPDIVRLAHHRHRAAAAKFATILDERQLTHDDYPDKIGRWLAEVASKGKGGQLDGVLGGFESAHEAAKKLAAQGSAAGFGPDMSQRLSAALVAAVVAFVECHPFRDEAGRYFS